MDSVVNSDASNMAAANFSTNNYHHDIDSNISATHATDASVLAYDETSTVVPSDINDSNDMDTSSDSDNDSVDTDF